MEVTQEAIQKAKELLGLIKADTTQTAAATTTTTIPVTTTTVVVDDLNKGTILTKDDVDKLKAEYTDHMSKAKEFADKAEAIKATLKDANVDLGAPNGGSGLMPNVGNVTMDSTKAEEQLNLIKAEVKKDNEELVKAIDSLKTLYSAKEQENVDLKKSLDELTSRVEEMAKQSLGAKSIITRSFIEKGSAGSDGNEQVLSITKDKRRVIAELTKAAGAFKDGAFEDDLFAKAASTMEFAGTIGDSPKEIAFVADRFKQKSKIRLVN